MPDVAADLIYKGALNNNGEYLGLYNVLNNLVDEIDCSSGWFTGDNTTKQTMEKTPIGWQMSENPGGTPRAKNGTGADIETKPIITAETPQNPPEPIKMLEEMPAENSSPQTYPGGIVFNEILPSPDGPDETEEWIEIYNQNNFEVDFAGWRVKDSEGNINIYVFPTATTIKSNGYLVLTRPLTKIILNNTGDRLILLKPDGKTSDIVSYTKSPTGQSYNKRDNEWHWSNVLTPGLTNIIKNETIEKTQNNKKETKENILNDKQIAAVLNQNTKQLKPFLSVLLTALLAAVISTTVFLFLKKRLKNK
ncbi:lamin tail domain-containing protein [Patescibacteria group bacterium]|nr:lamin tail domain-containing protein [Patescibacteria group bacterium]